VSRLRSALLFSAIAQQSNLIISFISIAIVARLLTPAEIGVFAVASAITVLAIEIRSFGVGQYLVRETELDDEKKRSAFGMMLLTSWSLAALVIISAPFVATFYRQPDLEPIFWILSGTFLLAPFSTVPFAMLMRDMRFDAVLRIKLASGFARAAGSVGFVLLGWSYFGLAASTLLGAVVELAAISLIDRTGSLMRPSFKLWREILRFGLVTSSTGVLQRFTQSVPDLVLGRTALSGIRRRQGNVGEEYLKCIVLHAAVSLPAFAVASVLALPLIRLFFGDQWDAAAPIASTLALWAMLQTVHGFLPNALIASDLERVALWKEAAVFVVRLALILAATSSGLQAVAWAIVLSGVFELALATVLAARLLGLSPGRVAKQFLPNIALAATCWLTAQLVSRSFFADTTSSLIQIAVVGVATLFVWLATLRIVKHDMWQLGTEALVDGIAAIRRPTKHGDTPS